MAMIITPQGSLSNEMVFTKMDSAVRKCCISRAYLSWGRHMGKKRLKGAK
jgi:hypothetical protein